MAGDPTEPTKVLPQDSQYGTKESLSSFWIEAANSLVTGKSESRLNYGQSERKKQRHQQEKDLTTAVPSLDPTMPSAPLDGSEPRV